MGVLPNLLVGFTTFRTKVSILQMLYNVFTIIITVKQYSQLKVKFIKENLHLSFTIGLMGSDEK